MSIFSINSRNAARELFAVTADAYAARVQDSVVVINNALAARANKILGQDAVDFSNAEIARLQTDEARLTQQRLVFADEAGVLLAAVTALGKIQTKLIEIQTALLALSSASTPEARANAAVLLDAKIVEINIEARNAGVPGVNLIGRPRDAQFRTANLIAAFAQGSEALVVQGSFQGTDFTVTDSGGRTWFMDRSTNELVQYDTWPDAPTGVRYAAGTLSVSSYDSGTGAITIDTPGGPVTGTLNRFGSGMLNSFLYNRLAGDADIDRAKADITAALAKFAIAHAGFGGSSAALQGWLERLDQRLSNIGDEVDAFVAESVSEKAARDVALKARIQAQQTAFSLMAVSSGALVDLFLRDSVSTGTPLDRFLRG